MELPLIVGYLPSQQAREALQEIAADVVALPSHEALRTAKLPRRPRLAAIQTSASDVDATRGLIRALQLDRPLIDVVVWAPHCGVGGVRAIFRAGASDVVVSRAPAALARAVQDALEQPIDRRTEDRSGEPARGARFDAMMSRSPAMWDLFDLCSRIAPAEATVLIAGETGTGKELLARAVHRRSQRPGRFVAANCASLPAELINSELFGHEKGAFTGADHRKSGLVRHARQGTLFLDEIGDMPPEAQQSLLRMLQERRVRPVGGLAEIEIDVRVVAATNVPLDQAMRDGRFREDLFYRLDVIRMNVPPLRERPEDILLLFGHFTKLLAKRYGLPPPTFADSFLDAMLAYRWPGNVRQLENFVERLILARPQSALTGRDFPTLQGPTLQEDDAPTPSPNSALLAEREPENGVDVDRSLQENLAPAVRQLERTYLHAVLRRTAGRIADAARLAGISRRTLLRKMTRYGLDKKDFKS